MKRKIVLTYLSPLVSVLGNLLLTYVVYFIARMTFLAENWNLYSDNLSWSHLMEMLRGGLMFDTTAILYTNALWVVMVLFPLHLKETKGAVPLAPERDEDLPRGVPLGLCGHQYVGTHHQSC